MSRDPGSLHIGRLAPSPTGRLHLGHARTFLIAFWYARSQGGSVLLRMEDLDGPRVVPGAADAILRDLEWLGIEWDGPVFVQSTATERTLARVRELLDRGKAYPCTCTRGDIRSAASAPQLGTEEARYPGTCRGRYDSMAQAERSSGRPPGIRFLVPDGEISLVDGIAGAVTSNVARDVGDFLIVRREGLPAYQLAVVVDDAAQGVTEVVRGDDLLTSAARQLLLQRALGLRHPSWWHVPLVEDAQGRRLAKRSDDLSLEALRTRGADPRSVIAWVAETCAMPPLGRVLAPEAASAFSMDRLPRRPIRVDEGTIARILGSL